MLNRRKFLRYSVATGLGLPAVVPAMAAEQPPNEFERLMTKCHALDLLGRPRSWSDV